jgi:hypothetical protein
VEWPGDLNRRLRCHEGAPEHRQQQRVVQPLS